MLQRNCVIFPVTSTFLFYAQLREYSVDIGHSSDRCFRMVEEIHQLLCVLGTLYLKLEYTMLPKLVNEIADLSQTLLKFYGCLRSEQELGKIKRFFKQSEITAQLEVCEVELKSALDVFRIQTGVGVTTALLQMSVDTEGRHQELLELIATRNDGFSESDSWSSIRGSLFGTIGKNRLNLYPPLHSPEQNSSNSLSLLPGSPKIFHGRERELDFIVAMLLCDPARAAILGPGGIGKSTLAIAALHHPAVTEKYSRPFFCRRTIWKRLGSLKSPVKKLRNFYLFWPMFHIWLSLATLEESNGTGQFPCSPRTPSSVCFTPNVPDIAEEPAIDEESDFAELLRLTENLPLAVNLMANIASVEGYSMRLLVGN
ncbi:hypothetical protein C8J57DRAFT_1469902 [Mycena rebaudengoi]|nr:hypothetical protein C8J57DRAFT_1469902 [Mycena rebaudengoi]